MVIVVGGGATGLGVAWDLSLRGVDVIVVEQADIGSGTSGRFHGLLHSGARYVVSDPHAARDCYEENLILKRIAPTAVSDSGGYFVRIDHAENDFETRWLRGCQEAGIPVKAVAQDTLFKDVPDINRGAARAFHVPDAVLEGFRLLQLLRAAVESRGGKVLTQTRLMGTRTTSNGVIEGVEIEGPAGRQYLACDALINAAGPYAEEVSHLFEHPIPMIRSAGMMMVFAHRHGNVVVNRLAPPGDGDILVPHQSVAILGTTDVQQESPDAPRPTYAEARRLMELGEKIFPNIASWRVLRAFVGVRPLYSGSPQTLDSRSVTRDYTLINHGLSGGPQGIFSLVGGKWTTFRKMAEEAVDAALGYLGQSQRCLTQRTPLAGSVENETRKDHVFPASSPILCECEQVDEAQVRASSEQTVTAVRTQTWFAMGPCQGTFCAQRVMAMRGEVNGFDSAAEELEALWQERSRGLHPVFWGENARQAMLQRAIRGQVLKNEVIG